MTKQTTKSANLISESEMMLKVDAGRSVVSLEWVPSLGKFRIEFTSGQYAYISPQTMAEAFIAAHTK